MNYTLRSRAGIAMLAALVVATACDNAITPPQETAVQVSSSSSSLLWSRRTNQPPVPSIASPSDAASFTQGAAVQFNGSANDPEQGALTGTSLQWSSSRDGSLGSGTTFSKSTLTVGTHVITLT
ncbi:MAG TPA: hypothetical protein VE967_11330, partial [Gemmatimonadaceae bacterium]|nr:hypothetical protein [Gemmatimonadaceae bacterium]